tara:strand:- start:3 stop:1004 length:1002 start_codon:yes stop_codon:yes gene_type:complete
LTLGDLVLFIHEPDVDLIEESYEIYDEAYKQAYFRGVYIKKELVEILLENDLWSPIDDRQAEEISKRIDNLKVEAFRSFFDTKKLRGIKIGIRQMEREFATLKAKKKCLDHVSCEGVAAFSRITWLVSQCTKFRDGSHYTWDKYPISVLLEQYSASTIDQEVIRKIARSEPWRGMWGNGKRQSNVFGKPSYQLTKDQLALCGYSTMYDNVYESMETPHDKVIEDDDCLDGWFVVQKRKMEKQNKQKEVDNMITNEKIANSQEIFVMAENHEAAQEIYDLNDVVGRSIIQSRKATIDAAAEGDGDVSFTEFQDIRQDIAAQQHREAINKIKGGR